MERATLVSGVAAAKKKDGLQIVQPAREARMMRRLLARHEGPLPCGTIIRIWRELVGSVALLQSGYSVAVCDQKGDGRFWDMTKEYFGGAVPMHKEISEGDVFSYVLNEDKEAFGVLPWPESNEKAWWGRLFEDTSLSIICALPYMDDHKALVISKVEFMDSESDHSFIALQSESMVSANDVSAIGFEVVSTYVSGDNHLFEVVGFVDRADSRLDALKSSLGAGCRYCAAVGGYPLITQK